MHGRPTAVGRNVTEQDAPATTWAIVPWHSVGPLARGATRAEVRAVLGSPDASFRKGGDAPNDTDAFDEPGIHTYYDDDDRLDYVECHSFGSVDPMLDGAVLRGDLITVRERLEGVGHQVVEEDDDDEYWEVKGTGVELYLYEPTEGVVRSVMVTLTEAAWKKA